MTILTRRKLIGSIGVGAGSLLLGGCDRIAASPTVRQVLGLGEGLTRRAQRLVTDRHALAREYAASDMSPSFRTNGNTMPASDTYQAHAERRFADWRLTIDGLVRRPLALSLAQVRAMPARTQITRHDCVEGWSAIGEWSGVPLSVFLQHIGADMTAKYVGFKCADRYYSSIDMPTALHAQTILALDFGKDPLPLKYGSPMKLRVPTKLGFKNPKHIVEVFVTNDYPGGYWEDQGYNWFSGL